MNIHVPKGAVLEVTLTYALGHALLASGDVSGAAGRAERGGHPAGYRSPARRGPRSAPTRACAVRSVVESAADEPVAELV